MKEKNKSFLFSLMALAMAAGVAGCSSTDEKVDDNPNYDPVTNTVNTQFVFSVSTSNGPGTRMSAANTQANGATWTFRGIQNANVLTFQKATEDPKIVIANTETPTKIFDLAQILSSGEISTSESRRVVELSLKLGTNTVMFYGKAIKNGDSKDMGSIDFHVGNRGNDTYFQLKQRNTDFATGSVFDNTEKILSTILNRIVSSRLGVETTGQAGRRDNRYAFWWPADDNQANVIDATAEERTKIWPTTGTVELSNGATESKTKGTTTQMYKLYAGEKTWKSYGTTLEAGTSQKPLEEKLGQAYNAFTKLGTHEVRSGSGYSISKTVGDLIVVLNKIRKLTDANSVGSVATSPEEYIAQLMAERIYTRISRYFTGSGTDCTFQSVETVINNLYQYADGTITTGTSGTYANVEDLASFPTNLNLPQGAVKVYYTDIEETSNPGFSYLEASTWIDGTGTEVSSVSITPSKIMWPAELCYFGNSPVRASSVPKTKDGYPQTVGDWVTTTNAKWSDFSGTSVVSSTRAVAMVNPINYGSSMLKTTVKYGAQKLKDNNSTINTGQDDNEIDATGAPFILTGILIGGQYDKVGWDYLPMDPSSNDRKDYIIYDNAIPNTAIPAYSTSAESQTASDANYTLVFDNYDSSLTDDAAQHDVLVCLEFQNKSGKDFYGQGNLIRDGATFYLVGKLDLSSAGDVTWPSASDAKVCHALPPYYTETTTTEPAHTKGDPKNVKRVFIQDYVTEANFKLDTNSLKYAFLTVPDLQASQISLGMSVDITWSIGPKFDDIPLGQ